VARHKVHLLARRWRSTLDLRDLSGAEGATVLQGNSDVGMIGAKALGGAVTRAKEVDVYVAEPIR
jgi:hypothetical protein